MGVSLCEGVVIMDYTHYNNKIMVPKHISINFSTNHQPSQMELQNILTASLQRGKTSPMSVLVMTLNNVMVRLQ